jgi:recombination protein RecR
VACRCRPASRCRSEPDETDLARTRTSAGPELERLIELLAKLPGLGPRSARRAALALLKKRDSLMRPLADAMGVAADRVKTCKVCGNLDVSDPCGICIDDRRQSSILCVVAEVGDLWALERSGAFSGRYHVLGGLLNALDGVRPDDLRIGPLVARVGAGGISEVVLALSSTMEGQSTAHYLADVLDGVGDGLTITRLAQGVPVGGELDHLDDGTLLTALRSRRQM